uniref:Cell adhesion molecule-related/down-regulated by oncogenes n=1 Tax=Mus musculus TaxID=10090 RepID=D6RHA1_MOUSE
MHPDLGPLWTLLYVLVILCSSVSSVRCQQQRWCRCERPRNSVRCSPG